MGKESPPKQGKDGLEDPGVSLFGTAWFHTLSVLTQIQGSAPSQGEIIRSNRVSLGVVPTEAAALQAVFEEATGIFILGIASRCPRNRNASLSASNIFAAAPARSDVCRAASQGSLNQMRVSSRP